MPYNFVNRWLCKYVHLMLTSESEEYPLKTKIYMRTLTMISSPQVRLLKSVGIFWFQLLLQ